MAASGPASGARPWRVPHRAAFLTRAGVWAKSSAPGFPLLQKRREAPVTLRQVHRQKVR